MPAGVKKLSRVFMTTDAVGGVWPYTLDLARGLGAYGIETILVVLGPSPDSERRAAVRDLPSVQLVDSGLPLDWTAESEAALAEANAVLAEMAEGCRPDIVHLNAPALAATERYCVPTVAMAHSCVTTWWRRMRRGLMPVDFIWRSAAMKRGLEAVDAVIAATRSFARELQEAHGAGFPVTVIPNGRKPNAISSDKQRLILTAGRLWDDAKNVQILDRAAQSIDAPIFAAGALTGPNGEAARFQHLHLLGPLDEHHMAQWLASAAIFASSARYEPFGLAVLEAAQAGSALVLSDIESFRELWDGAALFVPAEDEAAWVTALQALLDAPRRVEMLAAAACERSRRYSIDAMVAGTLHVYSLLLERNTPSAPQLSEVC